jgi:hypothetical protein
MAITSATTKATTSESPRASSCVSPPNDNRLVEVERRIGDQQYRRAKQHPSARGPLLDGSDLPSRGARRSSSSVARAPGYSGRILVSILPRTRRRISSRPVRSHSIETGRPSSKDAHEGFGHRRSNATASSLVTARTNGGRPRGLRRRRGPLRRRRQRLHRGRRATTLRRSAVRQSWPVPGPEQAHSGRARPLRHADTPARIAGRRALLFVSPHTLPGLRMQS